MTNMLDAARSRAENAYLQLRDEILHGALMPGESLRAAELQTRFGFGLTPIREAIMRLSTEGLVEAEANRSARVSGASMANLADLMATRRDIERLCLEQAIQHGDAAWEAEIVASLHLLSRTELPAAPTDRAAAATWEERHRRFHAALVAACPSTWLMRFWNTLATHSERYRKIRLLHHSEPYALVCDVNADHARLAETVIRRDAERAVTLMDGHLRATEQAVAHLLRRGIPQRQQEQTSC